MFVELDPDSKVPLFQQLHDHLLLAIGAGEIADGQQLEPVRTVAASFGINPATVKKAYDLLREEGLLDTRNRARSVVSLPTTACPEHIEIFREQAKLLITKARCQGLTSTQIEEILWTLR